MSEDLSNYKEIQGYSRYVINDEAKVYDCLRNKFILPPTDNRYVRILLRDDAGNYRSRPLHRVLMETWKPVHNQDELQVNHIDGDKQNNNLSNLEWCTGSENRIHAIENYLVPVAKPIIFQDSETGEIKEFRSIKNLADFLNMDPSTLGRKLRNTKFLELVNSGKVYFKYKKHNKRGTSGKTKILCKNVKEDKVYVFESLNQASEYINLSSSNISDRLSKDPNREYPDEWRVRKFDNNTDWGEDFIEVKVDIDKIHTSVQSLNVDTKKVRKHLSKEHAALDLNASISVIHKSTSNGIQKVFKNKENQYFIIKDNKDNVPWRKIKDLKEEMGTVGNGKIITTKNHKTEEVRIYASIAEASEDLGVSAYFISKWINENPGEVTYKNLSFQ